MTIKATKEICGNPRETGVFQDNDFQGHFLEMLIGSVCIKFQVSIVFRLVLRNRYTDLRGNIQSPLTPASRGLGESNIKPFW